MATRSWKILKWPRRPEILGHGYALYCPNCGAESLLKTGVMGSPVIAAIGLSLIFDQAGYTPPPGSMPDEIQCRACKKIYSSGDG